MRTSFLENDCKEVVVLLLGTVGDKIDGDDDVVTDDKVKNAASDDDDDADDSSSAIRISLIIINNSFLFNFMPSMYLSTDHSSEWNESIDDASHWSNHSNRTWQDIDG